MLIIGDSHVRPLTIVKKDLGEVVSISGATMSGSLNPASKTMARAKIFEALKQYPEKVVVFALGEVDVGFLCLQEKTVSLVEAKIADAIDKYFQLIDEVTKLYPDRIFMVANICPVIMSDFFLRYAKIRLRRKCNYDFAQRNGFVLYANDMIQMLCEKRGIKILDFYSALGCDCVGRKHINPFDHHFSSGYYIKSVLPFVDLEGRFKKIPAKVFLKAFFMDVRSFWS